MSTTTLDNRGNNGLLLIMAVVIIAAIALGTLELTRHAAQGRVNTTMDAQAIRARIDNKTCSPVKAYVCPLYNQAKVICKLKGDLWGGLILGTSVEPPVIVTGYVAPHAYWLGTIMRDECYEVGWSGL